jgi:hypothetical protein
MIPPLLKPRLRARGGIPYGGEFKLNLPDLGFVGSGTTFDMLMTNIRKWRFANGMVNGLGLEEEVERELCKAYAVECEESDERVPTRHSAAWSDVLRFTRVMVSHWWNNRQTESQTEANQRAAVCIGCPNNCAVTYPCSGRCGDLKELARVISGGGSTPHDERLQQCAICLCDLQSAIWVPLEYQQSVLTDEQKAQFRYAAQAHRCWKGKGL